MDYSAIRMPEPRIYCYEDLFPGKWDPRCTPRFPLGNFWPVYVGNFWCEVYSEHATKVQEYFASKGLLVRMVFGREPAEDPHFKHQRVYHLYDFLVYFVRQQDADDAISYCHREMYYGHRLNVFPGRVPSYFDPRKSVKHVIQQPLRLPMTEQIFETYIESVAQVTCVVQHNRRSLLVEYVSVKDRAKAVLRCRVCLPQLINPCQQKQRFIELDVQQEIFERFQKDPTFVNMVPPDLILGSFFNGIRFNCYHWRFFSKLRMPSRMQLMGNRSLIVRHHITAFDSALKNFGVKCRCKIHAWKARNQKKRIEHAKNHQSNSKPAVKLAEPSPGNNLPKEAAVCSAPNAATNAGSLIQPLVVAVQAPGVNKRVATGGNETLHLKPKMQKYNDDNNNNNNNFYGDSYDVDMNLGTAF